MMIPTSKSLILKDVHYNIGYTIIPVYINSWLLKCKYASDIYSFQLYAKQLNLVTTF